MKIGHHHSESLPQPAVTAGSDATTAKAAARTSLSALQSLGSPDGSPVSISLAATSLASQASSAGGHFDADKVSAVRDAIANGTYKVNPEAIADKLLSNAQEMLRRSAS
jgi:negative regulator of flagellin synthesis FlgM